MRRVFVAGVIISAFGVLMVAGSPAPGVVAQDDETAELQTRVAGLETVVARQSRQIATLAEGSEPTTTVEPTATAAPERERSVIAIVTPTGGVDGDAGGPPEAAGTREDPIPLGTEADAGGGWRVTVLGSVPDGTEEVLAENPFNEAPEDGSRFFLIRVSASFTGTGSASILGGLGFQAVGDTAVAYDSLAGCGVLPDALPTTEVFAGGTIEGNICFAVADEDVESLLLFSDSYVTFDDEDRVYYSLRRAGR